MTNDGKLKGVRRALAKLWSRSKPKSKRPPTAKKPVSDSTAAKAA